MFSRVPVSAKVRYPEPMEATDKKVIGANIAAFRRLKEMSQRELAAKLHVHQTMVARWELGQTLPRKETLKSIAEVLGVTLDELKARPDQESVTRALHLTEDPELNQLLGLLGSFDVRDRDALKTFLEAIAMKNRMKQALSA